MIIQNEKMHKFSLLQMTDLFENYPFEAVCGVCTVKALSLVPKKG